MGAATSVLRAAEDRGLAACVLDSPFCSLPDVARGAGATRGEDLFRMSTQFSISCPRSFRDLG
eukprot:987346-Pyramimonas_sp.AAC.1